MAIIKRSDADGIGAGKFEGGYVQTSLVKSASLRNLGFSDQRQLRGFGGFGDLVKYLASEWHSLSSARQSNWQACGDAIASNVGWSVSDPLNGWRCFYWNNFYRIKAGLSLKSNVSTYGGWTDFTCTPVITQTKPLLMTVTHDFPPTVGPMIGFFQVNFSTVVDPPIFKPSIAGSNNGITGSLPIIQNKIRTVFGSDLNFYSISVRALWGRNNFAQLSISPWTTVVNPDL